MSAIFRFVQEKLLSPQAAQAVHRHLLKSDSAEARQLRRQSDRLRRELQDLERKIRNLALQMAEEPDRRHPAVAAARRAIGELEDRRRTVEALLAEKLEAQVPPVLSLDQVEAAISRLALPAVLENSDPQALHRLFQSLELEVHYASATKEALVKVTIAAGLAAGRGGSSSVGGGT